MNKLFNKQTQHTFPLAKHVYRRKKQTLILFLSKLCFCNSTHTTFKWLAIIDENTPRHVKCKILWVASSVCSGVYYNVSKYRL